MEYHVYPLLVAAGGLAADANTNVGFIKMLDQKIVETVNGGRVEPGAFALGVLKIDQINHIILLEFSIDLCAQQAAGGQIARGIGAGHCHALTARALGDFFDAKRTVGRIEDTLADLFVQIGACFMALG